MNKLEVRGLTKRFKKRTVVDGLNLEVESGQVVGLLGPNGAGKTSSFYMIVGLLPIDGGSVLLDGEDISDLPMYERANLGISYLSQEPSVFRKLTVEDNIRGVLEYMDIPKGEIGGLIEEYLGDLGISRLAKTKAYALSGGERRRLEIARAMVMSPSFFLLDEPFSGIDPIAVGEIQDILISLKEKGIGILITDHNVGATLGICDHGYIIGDGKVLKEGTPEEILESDKVREVYLGNKFRL